MTRDILCLPLHTLYYRIGETCRLIFSSHDLLGQVMIYIYKYMLSSCINSLSVCQFLSLSLSLSLSLCLLLPHTHIHTDSTTLTHTHTRVHTHAHTHTHWWASFTRYPQALWTLQCRSTFEILHSSVLWRH